MDNCKRKSLHELQVPFRITAHYRTDIWRKPPSVDDFDGPVRYTVIPMSKFRSMRVTVAAQWKTKFDQGGLIFIMPAKSTGSVQGSQWIKAGIEHFNNEPYASCVATDRYSDWSLTKIETRRSGWTSESAQALTLEFEREVVDGEVTSTLWVYLIQDNNRRQPMREVAWVFGGDEEADPDRELWIGMYAAKVTADEGSTGGDLEVTFSDFELKLA